MNVQWRSIVQGSVLGTYLKGTYLNLRSRHKIDPAICWDLIQKTADIHQQDCDKPKGLDGHPSHRDSTTAHLEQCCGFATNQVQSSAP